MQNRLKEITSRLGEYSLGKFDKRIILTSKLDDIDAISNGINMLGEELNAITISRDYFTNIFNSVSDIVLIINSKGNIEDANAAAEDQLNYEHGSLKDKCINDLHGRKASFFKSVVKELKLNNPLIGNETVFITKNGRMIPVRYNACFIKNSGLHKQFILFTATDITFQIKTGNLIIRTILDAQEKERTRLAKDLHDSLSQELSAIKFYVSSTSDFIRNKRQKTALLKAKEALTEVIGEIRNICFNLMPKSLEEFGLIKAVKDYCNYFLVHKRIHFEIKQNCKLPELASELKIDLYRVIQEFITNAVKHGNANKISICFDLSRYSLKLNLMDNGRGFNCNKQKKGMGLQNVQSRVKSHYGKLNIVSNINKGTVYRIVIPLTN